MWNRRTEPKRKIKNRKSNRMKNDVFLFSVVVHFTAKCRNKCVLRVRNYKVLTRACCCCCRHCYSKWTLTVKKTYRRLLICISGIAYAACTEIEWKTNDKLRAKMGNAKDKMIKWNTKHDHRTMCHWDNTDLAHTPFLSAMARWRMDDGRATLCIYIYFCRTTSRSPN